jgi:uncharacterized membrane protein YczE
MQVMKKSMTLLRITIIVLQAAIVSYVLYLYQKQPAYYSRFVYVVLAYMLCHLAVEAVMYYIRGKK